MKLVVTAILLSFSSLAGAKPRPQPDITLDAAARNLVIDRALALLNEHYVFPSVAKQMEAAIRQHQQVGEYDPITSALVFRERLEDDLRAVSKDKHLRIFYIAKPEPEPPDNAEFTKKKREQLGADYARQNFCFERIERLAGNIGYIDFRCFGPPDLIAETVSAVFTFLAQTSALIIDRRENTGGEPEGVALISSYLFGKPTHLNDIYIRRDHRTDQSLDASVCSWSSLS